VQVGIPALRLIGRLVEIVSNLLTHHNLWVSVKKALASMMIIDCDRVDEQGG
jgi:hypothetical protein